MATVLSVATTTVTWTDNTNALTDTPTLTLQVQHNHDAWNNIASITHSSTGVYTASYNCLYPGTYIFEWYGITSGGLSKRVRSQVVVN